MVCEAGLALAENDGAMLLQRGVTIAFSTAAALVALLARWRMPAGSGEGTFVAAVSGGTLLFLAADSTGRFTRPAVGHVLTALTVFWYALSRIDARRPIGPGRRQSRVADSVAGERSQVLAYAALVCGLAAVVYCCTAAGRGGAVWPALAVDLVVLLLLCAAIRLVHSGTWASYPLITLLVCLAALVFPSETLNAYATALTVGMNLAGLASLLLVIGAILLGWWRRRRRWLEDPQRLPVAPPTGGPIFAALVGVSALVGIGGVLVPEAVLAPTAVVLAAVTCLTIGHLRGWLAAGEIGLILLGEGVAVGSMAWMCPGWRGALLGLGLAGLYLLWLARFWDQQLRDGEAWTTAGRLIPAARRVGIVAVVGAVAAAFGQWCTGDFSAQDIWTALVTGIVLLAAMNLWVRDSCERDRVASAFAACLATLALTGPLRTATAALGSAASPVAVIPFAALLLAFRISLSPPGAPAAAVYGACLRGALPIVVLFGLTVRGLDGQSVAGLVLAVSAVVVGSIVLRDGRQVVRAKRTGGE